MVLICEHRIEGNNIAHLGFGSSAAKTLTLSILCAIKFNRNFWLSYKK